MKFKPINCPLCGGEVLHKRLYRDSEYTFMWSCVECPCVIFEYYSPYDTLNIENYFSGCEDTIAEDGVPTKDAEQELLQDKLTQEYYQQCMEDDIKENIKLNLLDQIKEQIAK